jgi:hypothetical protein
MPMNAERGEKIVKPRISLYLEKEKTHAIDDMRLLMTLNGRNMDSILEFTDMIDAMIYYAYRNTFPKVNDLLLREFLPGTPSMIVEEKRDEVLDILKDNEIEITKQNLTGYDAKIYLLKDYYKDLIEKSILNINKVNDTIIEYSDFIKKSIDFILKNETIKLDFFLYIYIGNLYNFSTTTSLKIGLFNAENDASYSEIIYPELKQLKLLNADNSIINELIKVITRTRKINNPDRQYSSLINELEEKRGLLNSSLWNFNYVDTFYGYAYSDLYLIGNYRSLVNLLENMHIRNLMYRVKKTPVKQKIADLYDSDKKIKRTLTLLEMDLERYVRFLLRFHNLSQLASEFNTKEFTELIEHKAEVMVKIIDSLSFMYE